jgi:hypothetical protein
MAALVDMSTLPAVDSLEMTAPSTLGVQLQRRSPGVVRWIRRW